MGYTVSEKSFLKSFSDFSDYKENIYLQLPDITTIIDNKRDLYLTKII